MTSIKPVQDTQDYEMPTLIVQWSVCLPHFIMYHYVRMSINKFGEFSLNLSITSISTTKGKHTFELSNFLPSTIQTQWLCELLGWE
jgi:hypothetical protein